MVKQAKLGSAKRYGARYGRRVKHKLAKIESVQRKKHKCPYCHAQQAKRKSAGIWECKKCGSKFTGKAYSIKKTITTEEKEKKEEKE